MLQVIFGLLNLLLYYLLQPPNVNLVLKNKDRKNNDDDKKAKG